MPTIIVCVFCKQETPLVVVDIPRSYQSMIGPRTIPMTTKCGNCGRLMTYDFGGDR